jgi:chromosome segregation ATPase
VTEAHLEAADAKIAQLEADKKAADLKAEQAATDLKTAQDAKAKADADLQSTSDKLATLEKWKNENKATDERGEDDSNKLDGEPEAKAAWEVTADTAIADMKRRLKIK